MPSWWTNALGNEDVCGTSLLACRQSRRLTDDCSLPPVRHRRVVQYLVSSAQRLSSGRYGALASLDMPQQFNKSEPIWRISFAEPNHKYSSETNALLCAYPPSFRTTRPHYAHEQILSVVFPTDAPIYGLEASAVSYCLMINW